MEIVDLVVVGGGINGTGIAADASGRGLKVILCEQDDLACATSSASTKLIHGGLRYLEQYEFRLVREALAEREVLLKKAPHIISPLRFRLPHAPHLRPAWMIRTGLWLYDHLGRRVTLPASRQVFFGERSVLQPTYTKGFEYSDCWVDDARLVVLNALTIAANGGRVMTRQRCVSGRRKHGLWHLQLEDTGSGEHTSLSARALVNATGPWVTGFIEGSLQDRSPRTVRLVQGSHIVVPQLHDEPEAYILQNRDGRIVFVIPYLDKYSLIGTTDVEYRGDPSQVRISREEKTYLCDAVNHYFRHQIAPTDAVWSYSGVRALWDDAGGSASTLSRDYSIELTDESGQAPLLSVFGGKITTYRKLAEAAMHKLRGYFPAMGPDWTAETALPGGDFQDRNTLQQQLTAAYPFIGAPLLKRWINQYGTLTHTLLDGVHGPDDLGACFGADLYQREVDYLICHEWARSSEDILWRRSKLGLELSPTEANSLQAYLHSRHALAEQAHPQ